MSPSCSVSSPSFCVFYTLFSLGSYFIACSPANNVIFTRRQWRKEEEGRIAECHCWYLGFRVISETSKSIVDGGLGVGGVRFERGCKIGYVCAL